MVKNNSSVYFRPILVNNGVAFHQLPNSYGSILLNILFERNKILSQLFSIKGMFYVTKSCNSLFHISYSYIIEKQLYIL